MRLIDADKLEPDRFSMNDGLAISQSQIANAPTVDTVPMSVLEDIKAEIVDYLMDAVEDEVSEKLYKIDSIMDKYINRKEQE